MNKGSAKTLAKLIYDQSANLKFAVGSGQGTWDEFNPTAFDTNKEVLYNETYRAAITSIQYVDPATLNPTASNGTTLSNALKIVGKVPATSSIDNTFVREKAVFLGGTTKDSGNLIHAETTAKETKVLTKELETIFYIIFQ